MAGKGRTLAVLIALAAVVAASPPTFAGGRQAVAADPFSALVGERREARKARRAAPQIERFTVAADGRAFLLEGGAGEARMKFLCTENDPRLDCRIDPAGAAEEIHIVSGVRGPRGDIIYRNHEGDMLLRLTSYGGATVFWPGETQGQPASRSFGEEASLTLPPANSQAAERRGRGATAVLSAATGEPIIFEVGGGAAPDQAALRDSVGDEETMTPPRADVLADAVVRVAVGMQRVAADPTGARILGVRVKSVEFRPGTGPRLTLDGGKLIVDYDPTGDVAGRPSSVAVTRFLEESL
jgi:hypothetical protein